MASLAAFVSADGAGFVSDLWTMQHGSAISITAVAALLVRFLLSGVVQAHMLVRVLLSL